MEIKSTDLQTAKSVMRWMADRCDFATSNDGEGFSGTDAPLGHALAEKDIWSQRETLAALNLLVKYKKQIAVGNFDLFGLDSVRANLLKELGATKVSKREMVSGDISVVDNLILIKTKNFNKQLVSEIQELVGRKWNADTKQNSCLLNADNAAALEGMAKKYGLKLNKHSGWTKLIPARRVLATNDALLISGVNARRIVYSMASPSGNPKEDEKQFTAINVSDETSICIPLKSWVIRDAILWFATLEGDRTNYERLGWARSEAIQLLGDAYPAALKVERENFCQASALGLTKERIIEISATLPASVAKKLMPHQWVAVERLMSKSQSFLADQQGLGKTIEILAALESVASFPAIVLAPATALLNWRDEIASWLPHRKVSVLGGSISKRDQGEPLHSADFVIINYESFSKHACLLAELRPQSLIADEAQYLKGHDSARTQAVKDFCKTSGVKRIFAATGTPVMNRPSELLTILKALLPDLLAELGGFNRFAARYCVATKKPVGGSSYWDYGGAANLGELANRLRETGRFVRREKSSALIGLAAKRYEFTKVDICNRAEYTKATSDFKEWLKTQNIPRRGIPVKHQAIDGSEINERSQIDLAAEYLGYSAEEIAEFRMDRSEAIRKLTALRQLTGIGKVTAAVRWIQKTVKDEKLIVFASHIAVQEALVAALSTDSTAPLTITGDMAARARHDAIFQFQNNPLSRVIVCSLKAAQTAITLTAAKRVLIVELDWTPATLEQAADRAHRIGQTGSVVVTYLHAENTLDDRMANVLANKQASISVVNASAAPYGYKKDGAPRLQPPGPGRPRLDAVESAARRKSSKLGWQARNSEYMRDYMRKRRLKAAANLVAVETDVSNPAGHSHD